MDVTKDSIEAILVSKGIEVGDTIRVYTSKGTFEGILMPRYEIFERNYITIKLANGYNIGIKYDPSMKIELISKHKKEGEKKAEILEKGDITIIGTGGTILSRIDYKTGAVKPSFNLEDLLELLPRTDLRISMFELFKIFSEDMKPSNWSTLAEVIYKEFQKGCIGVIVTHGTDTLGLTAAALSFALQDLAHPLCLVGAQRSLDRPSSDAALNLRSAFNFLVKSKYSGVFAVMHSSTSDESCDVILGTRVRKNHTSRRDAFKSINRSLVARIKQDEIIYEEVEGLKERGKGEIKLMNKFEEKVFLLKTFPGISYDFLSYIVDKGYKGILIEGTGLGHAPASIIEGIKYAVERNVFVAMASQCIWGRVNMNVYERGRMLLKLGVIGSEDMFPETALVKMMWSLANSRNVEEAKKLYLTNIVGEISNRLKPI